MAAWAGGFSGKGYTRPEFRAWLRTQPKPPYHRAIVHNTDAPFIVPPHGIPARVAALKNFYQNERKWSGGPDFFVFGGEDKVYLGSPLGKSIGCTGWNGNSFHVETEGKFTTASRQDPRIAGSEAAKAWDTNAWVFAELCEWMGWPIDGTHIMLHKEAKTDNDPKTKTTHDCPGNLIGKGWFLNRVQVAAGIIAGPTPAPAPTPPPARVTRWVNTPNDSLNFRDAPNGKVKGVIPHGIKLEVLGGSSGWSHVETPGRYQGWVASRYLSATDPHPVPAPKPAPAPAPAPAPQPKPAPVPEPPEHLFQPGSYRYSDFCISWAKRFEGNGKPGKPWEAYWDVNDWAIGHGHNNGSGVAPAVKKGDKIDEKTAHEILISDLNLQLRYLEAYVDVPLTQGQIDALVLHIFQQGPGNFREGRVRPLVNAGKHKEAALAIKNWPTANAGLIRRRDTEHQIYLGAKPTKW
jgi:GH24 family phage-related lysozyme (muramidase)